MFEVLVLVAALGYCAGLIVQWLAGYGASSRKPDWRSDPNRRLYTVSQSNLIGLPSKYFADDEVLGSRVRLLTDQDVGDGHRLMKGECFVVASIRAG